MTDTGQAAVCPNDSSPTRPDVAVTGAPLFVLGQMLATPGALSMLKTLRMTGLPLLLRHVSGDWGDICAEDRQANIDGLRYGNRLMSVYVLSPSERLCIITEADRSSTTLLLPEEY